jgi:transcriptional regulator with XRE-family HTH domain
MANPPKKPESTTSFGQAFGACLDSYGKKPSALAAEMGVTRSYISSVSTGKKSVGAGKVDEIADKIGVTDQERTVMHRAAAKDAGFRIDLPDDF